MLDINDIINEKNRVNKGDDNGGGGGGFINNFVRMPEGKGVVIVRLLPPAKKGMFNREKNPFYVATRIHRMNGRSIHCPRTLNNKRWEGDCPICSMYSYMWKESEKAGNKELQKKLQNDARKLKPNERFYYNCIARQQLDRNGKIETNVGPLILSVGEKVHAKIIIGIAGDPELQQDGLGDVTDFKDGFDFKIVKQLTKGGDGESYPSYSESVFQPASVLGTPDQIQQWLDGLHDLAALRIIKSTEELKRELKIHLGLIKDDVNNGFDPSEFQPQSSSSVVVNTVEAPKPVEYKAPKPQAAAVAEEKMDAAVDNLVGNTSMADDDFINELRNS